MKKLLSIIFSSVCAILILASVEVRAADISVGAATWYTWWDYEDHDSSIDSKVDPGFLYGPSLSVKFNDDYNLTFQFLYGKFDWNEYYDGADHEFDFTREDSDLAINYRLNSWFKIFAGGKYMNYSRTESGAIKHEGIGPGVGLSLVLPLGSNFYLLETCQGFISGVERMLSRMEWIT